MKVNSWLVVPKLLFLTTVFVLFAATAQAVPPGMAIRNAGLQLQLDRNRLFVVNAPLGILGLQAGDQIVAVNGGRVATEVAFNNRLKAGQRGGKLTITVIRNGKLQTTNSVPPLSTAAAGQSGTHTAANTGWMNASLMVKTSQGVMHRDAAARLGLTGEPLGASSGGSDAPRR